MTISEILNKEINELKNNKIIDSSIIAKDILALILKKDKQYLLIHRDEKIDIEKINQLESYIEKIINGVPLQYITNKQEFMGYEFYVNENVLIPQPDTEILVEQSIKKIKTLNVEKQNKILDLCTGSGAIAISIDKIINKGNKYKIYASDISKKALEVTNINKEKLDSNIHLIESNLFQSINEKFDVIISNPPYINTDVIKTLSKEVQNEPNIALDGGIDGLDFYKEIINNSKEYLNNQGYLCLEIGYDQKDRVIELLKQSKIYENIESYKDLSNNDRCIIARRK